MTSSLTIAALILALTAGAASGALPSLLAHRAQRDEAAGQPLKVVRRTLPLGGPAQGAWMPAQVGRLLAP